MRQLPPTIFVAVTNMATDKIIYPECEIKCYMATLVRVHGIKVVLVCFWHVYSVNQSDLINLSLPALSSAVLSSAMYTCSA